MKVLFLAARFPAPPLKGDQMRAYHQLRLLGARHEITLLTFDDCAASGDDEQAQAQAKARAEVAGWCEVVTVPLRRSQMAWGALRGALSSLPLQTAMHADARMALQVQQLLQNRSFDLRHVQLVRMAPYFGDGNPVRAAASSSSSPPRVVDLIDALSLNMNRRAAQEGGLKGHAARVEARRLLRYERHLCRTFEAATVVSPTDRAAIEQFPGEFPHLHVNPHAVDLDQFSPLQVQDDAPQDAAQDAAPTLVFSGNMSYFPNANAAQWLVRAVWPLIRAQAPGARLDIVGANPGRGVLDLGRVDGVRVLGFVASMRAHLARATVAVVPMQAGSGMQSKVVEAMACGAPVVATPVSLGGLEVQHDTHLLIAADAPAFAQNVLRLLHDAALRRRLSEAARHLVEERYSWPVSTSHLEAIWQQVAQGQRAAQG